LNQKLSAAPALTLKFCLLFFWARYYVENVRLEQFWPAAVIKLIKQIDLNVKLRILADIF
jgi:hypothetical protein